MAKEPRYAYHFTVSQTEGLKHGRQRPMSCRLWTLVHAGTSCLLQPLFTCVLFDRSRASTYLHFKLAFTALSLIQHCPYCITLALSSDNSGLASCTRPYRPTVLHARHKVPCGNLLRGTAITTTSSSTDDDFPQMPLHFYTSES